MTQRPLNVLRTAAGSSNTITQYRAFQRLGCRIVAADCEPGSVGFHFADAFQVVPRVADPGYLEAMVELCAREQVDLFLPALDEELELLARNRARFTAVGTNLLLSEPGALATCLDKYLTYVFFREEGIPTPRTLTAGTFFEDSFEHYPVVVKPRAGRGSAGVHLARNPREAAFFCGYLGDAVVQECLQGMEYTIDVLAGLDSELLMVSSRQRLATESGISSRGQTFWQGRFLPPLRAMVRALGLIGPLNVQCFVAASGEVRFTEINARLAGTAILSQAAGVPLFEGILALTRGERPSPWLRACEPLQMFRYWEELFLKPAELPRLAGALS
jgi:carbamoyl-phosphate synthase large subunit